jgi:ABC-type nitrate/sulfonate/bicarbonate transport system substrate-binding protein
MIDYIDISAYGIFYYWVQYVENADEPRELYDDGSFDDDDVGVYAFMSYEDAEKYANEHGYTLGFSEE